MKMHVPDPGPASSFCSSTSGCEDEGGCGSESGCGQCGSESGAGSAGARAAAGSARALAAARAALVPEDIISIHVAHSGWWRYAGMERKINSSGRDKLTLLPVPTAAPSGCIVTTK